MSGLESPKSYGSAYKFGVAKGVVENLHGVVEFMDDDVSERSSLCVIFQDSLAGFILSFCILVVLSRPSKFHFYTDVCLLLSKLFHQFAVFVLSSIVCTVRDNWFKFLFATFFEFFNVRDSWCRE